MFSPVFQQVFQKTFDRGLVAAAAFLPTDVPGLLCWHDFSLPAYLYQDAAKTTPVTADGQVIGAAVDRSTNGRDATQAILANKPVYKASVQNGLSMALADLTDRLVTPSIAHNIGTGNFYVAAVIKSGPQTHVFAGLCGNATYAPGFYVTDQHTDNLVIYWAGRLVFATLILANTAYLIEYWRASGTIYAAVNGVQDALTSTAARTMSNGTWSIMGDTPSSGDGLEGHLGDIVFYNNYPSASIAALRTYFNSKWAVY